MQLREVRYSPHRRRVIQSHQPRRQFAHDVEVGNDSHQAKPVDLLPVILSTGTRNIRRQ